VRQIGPAASVAAANAFMLNQVNGPFNASPNSPIDWSDCGPTAMVVALSALRLMSSPGPAGAAAAISRMRELMHPTPTTELGMWPADLVRGALANRALARVGAPSLADIDAALAQRGVAVVEGVPKNSWASWLSARGWYLTDGSKVFRHWIAITGKTPAGNYIVCDPLSRVGALEVSPERVQQYMDDQAPGSVVAVSAPSARPTPNTVAEWG
jgi:hypothetical protein